MLGLFKNKSDHPLANLKSAHQLLSDLPKTDAVEVLHEISHWIEALFDPANGFRLDHQFAVLRMLDEAAHTHLRKVTQSYFAVVPPNTFAENRLWGAINSYTHFCDLGYLYLLMGLEQEAKGSSGIRLSLALICARGIYAVFAKMECVSSRYMQVDPLLWDHLATYFSRAESGGCLEEPVAIYAGMGMTTTVRQSLGCALMWYTAGVGTFSPLDMHIAKRLIAYLGKFFTASDKQRADSMFVFDLAKPSSPGKIKESGTMYPPSTRFIGSGNTESQFNDILKTLDKGLVPAELNMGVPYSAEMVGDVARQLSKCCSSPLPSRRDQRRKIKVCMNVAKGFTQVVEKVIVDFNFSECETWDVDDISKTGLSLVLPAGKTHTIKIGDLIGLQPEKIQHWSAGIVRRLSRDTQNNLRVGVELLASRIVSVVLHGHDGADANAQNQALYLDKPESQNGEGWLLMKQDSFSINRSPTMTMDEQSFLLIPLELVEKGEDFDLVRYRKMAQDGNSDDAY